jgi:hypothetical protein
MIGIFFGILSWGITCIPPFFFAALAMFLCKSTLINMKFILFVGTAGMIALPILLKDFVYKFVEWQVVEEIYDFGRATQEEAIHTTYWLAEVFLLPAIGGGLFLSTFLFINLMAPTSDIVENIQTPILQIRNTYAYRKHGLGPVNGKEATVKIKNYVKDVIFPLEAKIEESQLLSFSVKKGYFGFDIIQKL